MKRALPILLFVGHSAWAQSIPSWNGLSAETAKPAHVSLSQDGAWLPNALTADAVLEVHDDRGARPQFLERLDGLELLFYVDRDALRTFSVGLAVLRPNQTAGAKVDAKAVAMQLGAGVPLRDVGAPKDGAVKVSLGWKWSGNSLEAHGYLDATSIGTVYQHAFVPGPEFVPDVTLPGDFKLLDAPNGTAWVFSKNQERVDAMVLERKNRAVLVRIAQQAVGWIAATQVKPIPKSVDGEEGGVEGGVLGGVIGGVAGGTGKPTLPAKTPLFDGIDGAFIGEVTDGFTHAPVEKKNGWQHFDITTTFGTVAVWAHVLPHHGLAGGGSGVDK